MENMIFSNSYIICATPRSGSTLLCDLLTDTQVAGCPDSFFRREDFLEWASYFDVSVTNWGNEQEFDQSYLTAVLQEGTGGTSIFGMRLMWESLSELSKRLASFHPGLPNDNARFQAVFGSPRYVHLTRENKVAQAVSRLKAEQSGLWHLCADGTERERLKFGQAPVYDAGSLAKIVARLEEQDAAWSNWFVQQEVEPICITYEALSDNPLVVLEVVLAALGLDPAIAKTVTPRTAKLADSQSREWAERFREELINSISST